MPVRNFGTFSRYFSQQRIADIVGGLPKPDTQLTDLLFPPERRVQKASPYITARDIQQATGAIPLVRRDGRSVPIDATGSVNSLIEVDPFKPSLFVLAKDINDMIAAGESTSLETQLAQWIQELRDSVSASTEILVRQAMSGKISYPYSTINGVGGVCEITLGTPHALKSASLTGTSNLPDIQKMFEAALTEHANKTGATGRPVFMMGDAAYAALVDVLVKMGSSAPVVWNTNGLTLLGKYTIQTAALTYQLPGSTEVKKIIADNSVRIYDQANPGKLIYASLDDLDANLAPLPFYAKPEEVSDPDGVKLIGASKPFPALAMSRQSEFTVVTK